MTKTMFLSFSLLMSVTAIAQAAPSDAQVRALALSMQRQYETRIQESAPSLNALTSAAGHAAANASLSSQDVASLNTPAAIEQMSQAQTNVASAAESDTMPTQNLWVHHDPLTGQDILLTIGNNPDALLQKISPAMGTPTSDIAIDPPCACGANLTHDNETPLPHAPTDGYDFINPPTFGIDVSPADPDTVDISNGTGIVPPAILDTDLIATVDDTLAPIVVPGLDLNDGQGFIHCATPVPENDGVGGFHIHQTGIPLDGAIMADGNGTPDHGFGPQTITANLVLPQ